jgi:hypothetical protein
MRGSDIRTGELFSYVVILEFGVAVDGSRHVSYDGASADDVRDHRRQLDVGVF